MGNENNEMSHAERLKIIRQHLTAMSKGVGALPPAPEFAPPAREKGESIISHAKRVLDAAKMHEGEHGDESAQLATYIRDAFLAMVTEAGLSGAAKLSGPRRSYTETDKRAAYKAFSEKKTPSEIALSLNISQPTLNNWKRTAGFVDGGTGIGVEKFLASFARAE